MTEQGDTHTNLDEQDDASQSMNDDKSEIIREIMIFPEDASTIKSQLFDLCKQGDIDKNDRISFDDFSSVIRKFLPNTTDKRLQEMFRTFDDNDVGTISYTEFLSEDNFNKFLQYCGYFTYHDVSDTSQDIPNLHHMFSVHDDHDKQIIMAQQDVIAKLNAWITAIGQPSELQLKDLQIQNESLRQELSMVRLELETIKQELRTLNEEKKSIKDEYKTTMNGKDTLERKLKHMKRELQHNEDALENYYKLETKWKEIETENANSIQENAQLKLKIEKQLQIIHQFEDEMTRMKTESTNKLQRIHVMNKEGDEFENIIEDMRDGLQASDVLISNQNAEIDDLREKLGMTPDDDLETCFHPLKGLVFDNNTFRVLDNEPQSDIGFDRMASLYSLPGVSRKSSVRMDWFYALEAEWTKVKEDLKMENERLSKELMKTKIEIEHERNLHKLEIERGMGNKGNNYALIGDDNGEGNELDVLTGNGVGNAPLLALARARARASELDDDRNPHKVPNPNCVLFGWPLF